MSGDTLREHLGSASMHLAVLMQNLTEDSDDWFTAQQAHAHVEACITLPHLSLVPDPEHSLRRRVLDMRGAPSRPGPIERNPS